MKKHIIFQGVGTALITPFKNGEIDYTALMHIIERQVEAGVEALIVGGTTAEAPVLSDSERYRLFAFSKACVGGRCKIIYGTGTNDIKLALSHTKNANAVGCDGILVVTPYYNKGTESGIVKHYLHIAEASVAPVLLYNVPTRTGVNLSLHILDQLAAHENIVGIKEASDSCERLCMLAEYGDELPLYAGNDYAIQTVLSLGGRGVISVLSNAYPEYVRGICSAFFKGDIRASLEKQTHALKFIHALFSETNPTPIKYVMSKLGLCSAEMRLPLDEATDATKRLLDCEMEKFAECG